MSELAERKTKGSELAERSFADTHVLVRVRGRVQGVGFRPNVWRIATALGLAGDVANDSEGVLIRLAGSGDTLETFLQRLRAEVPPLAVIDDIVVTAATGPAPTGSFVIAASRDGAVHTPVTPDAAVCLECRRDMLDPFSRRFRYPFTTCTHCGPRFSIVQSVPYDRARTTMAKFPLCRDCAAEYADPADRRFHAEPIACHTCGPRGRIERMDGRAVTFDQHSMLDDVDAAGGLIRKGFIVAIKGLGGYQLACDATRADVVDTLRTRKRRDTKPFALMARDLDVIRRFASVSPAEEALLASPEGPIVLLRADGPERMPETVAPGLDTLGFMLPTTPLHILVLRRLDRPVVMTSGNVSDEPQVIDDDAVRPKLSGIADHILVHDRPIANRVDDSVVRIIGGTARVLRRARGFAPGPIRLPKGFEAAPDCLALGGELKSTFCLVKDGAAVLSQHIGDLEDPEALDDFAHHLSLYRDLLDHTPQAIAIDRHPDYLSAKLGRTMAAERGLPLVEVQHHHAHVASCLAENGVPLDAPPVLGIALDGLGYGDGGALWGGEFLVCDYRSYRRVGTLKPVAMIGGALAAKEPWRNLYAHLMAEMTWPQIVMNYSEAASIQALAEKPRATLDAMLRTGTNVPPSSSCGRLFDAVAAALDIAFERSGYEGETGARLEALVDPDALASEDEYLAYPLSIPVLKGSYLPYIEPLAMWQALLGDLAVGTAPGIIAARFHRGLAKAITAMALKVTKGETDDERAIHTVALTGGCLANSVLHGELVRRLEAEGFRVLTHTHVPAGDGGLSLGQAAITAAHLISRS
jgi:hydrogenase maturation protein HypF